MKNTARLLLVSMLLAGTGTLMASCQSDPDMDITKIGVETDPPDVLYNQGLANFKAGNTTEAIRKFDAIDREHPFTDWARKALVMSTFVKYRKGDFQEAINSGNRYMNQYPNTEDSAYVQYLIGLSYSKQIPDVTQDQRASARTIDAMQKVVDNYQKSEYVEDSCRQIGRAHV